MSDSAAKTREEEARAIEAALDAKPFGAAKVRHFMGGALDDEVHDIMAAAIKAYREALSTPAEGGYSITAEKAWVEPVDNPLLPNDVLRDNQARAYKADGASGSMVIDTSVALAMIAEIFASRALQNASTP